MSPLVVIEKQNVKPQTFPFPTTGKKTMLRKVYHTERFACCCVPWGAFYVKLSKENGPSCFFFLCGFNSHQEGRHRLKTTHSHFKLETSPAVGLTLQRETWWKSLMDGASNFWLSWNGTKLLEIIDRHWQHVSTSAASAHENRSDFCLPRSDVAATLTTCQVPQVIHCHPFQSVLAEE